LLNVPSGGPYKESQIGRILPSLESLVKKMNMVVTAGYFLAKYIILQEINCGNTDLASLMAPGFFIECMLTAIDYRPRVATNPHRALVNAHKVGFYRISADFTKPQIKSALQESSK
jgi:hypothetical protein